MSNCELNFKIEIHNHFLLSVGIFIVLIRKENKNQNYTKKPILSHSNQSHFSSTFLSIFALFHSSLPNLSAFSLKQISSLPVKKYAFIFVDANLREEGYGLKKATQGSEFRFQNIKKNWTKCATSFRYFRNMQNIKSKSCLERMNMIEGTSQQGKY